MNHKINQSIPLLKSSDSRVVVGRYTYGEPWLRLWTDEDKIKIGSFCSISSGVNIFGGGEHNSNWISTYPFRIVFDLTLANSDGHPKTKGITTIGSDVWIGHGATILSGVTVGDGAIIGANAVVAKDVPPYSVVVGNPAKVIRLRFPKDKVEKLLKLKWWDWDINVILKNVDILCGGDVDRLIGETKNGCLSKLKYFFKRIINVHK